MSGNVCGDSRSRGPAGDRKTAGANRFRTLKRYGLRGKRKRPGRGLGENIRRQNDGWCCAAERKGERFQPEQSA
jgi:hypothetical protein